MAQLSSNEKRIVSKPDMNPLVDLGFLLITFFIYTATFTKPVQFSYNQPIKDGNHISEMKKSNSMTIIIGKNDELFYHQKTVEELSNLTAIPQSKIALRTLIIDAKSKALDHENFNVIIKPSEFSTYNQLVDMLDEMVITNQELYAVVDISDKEKSLLLVN